MGTRRKQKGRDGNADLAMGRADEAIYVQKKAARTAE
jgi:hypothetical protein